MTEAEKLLPGESLRQGFPKLNMMIDMVNYFQKQIDQMVIQGDSSVEAAQARVDGDGTTYTTLKERLDTEHSEVTMQLEQTTQINNQRSFYEAIKNRLPLIAGHKGHEKLAPENTLPSMLLGSRHFDMIECDVLMTSDKEFVINHDYTVDVMTNGSGNVSEMTYEAFMNLIIDSGSNISRYPNLKPMDFKQFLDCCNENNVLPLIEIKASTVTDYEISDLQRLLDIVEEKGLLEKVTIISFNKYIVQRLRDLNSNISIGWLVTTVDDSVIQWCIDYRLGLSMEKAICTKENVKRAKQNGLFTSVWTVETYFELKQFKDMGVDIITTSSIVDKRGLN